MLSDSKRLNILLTPSFFVRKTATSRVRKRGSRVSRATERVFTRKSIKASEILDGMVGDSDIQPRQ